MRIVNKDEVARVRNERDGACLYGAIHKDGCEGILAAHHIQTRGSGGDDVQENLITLCTKHHNMAHAARIKPEELRAILTRYFGYQYGVSGAGFE